MVVQALTADKLQATHEEAAASAGEAGVLRICVLGQTRVAVTMPATFAAVLRLPFQTKPESPYDVMTMMVCSLHFQNDCKLPYPSVVRYTCVMYATCASLALPSASEPVMHGRVDVKVLHASVTLFGASVYPSPSTSVCPALESHCPVLKYAHVICIPILRAVVQPEPCIHVCLSSVPSLSMLSTRKCNCRCNVHVGD